MKRTAKLPLVVRDPQLEPLRDIELIELPVKQILNRCTNPRMHFRWTINPYRGCEFGCVYCYARYTHTFMELHDPLDFERKIFVKRKAAEVLAHTLARTPIGEDQIALGTATDPYQPAERKFGVTRSLLEVFASVGGLNLSITTKSALILRDLELLAAINRRSRLSVNFSLITLHRRLQRLLEPRAPRPALRLNALRQLTAAGIRCNVLMMPMIPELTDAPAPIEAVVRAARQAGASGLWWRSLYLKPEAARRFIPYIQEHFPDQAARITAIYSRAVYAPSGYDQRLEALFNRLKRKYGFDLDEPRGAEVGTAASAAAVTRTATPLQLALLGVQSAHRVQGNSVR